MAGNQYVLLLLILITVVEQCYGVALRLPVPKPKRAEKMPKDMFKRFKNMTSTSDFLKSTNRFNEAMKSGVLPSQVKPPLILRSRSSGSGTSFQDMLNLDFQTCMVRPTIHFLQQPPLIENAFIWPHAVQLPLCTGSCGIRRDILACHGMTKVEVSMQAYRVLYHSSRTRRDVMEEFSKLKDPIHKLSKRSADNIQNITVKLEAHADCKCGCTATEEMCKLENKTLNRDICQCECPAQTCKFPLEWDENQCKCVCKKDRVSNAHWCLRSSGYRKTWDHNKCACVCINRPPCTPMNTFDQNTCLCTCDTNPACPPHQSLRLGNDRYTYKQCYCK